jgi:hypothetical protein
LLPLNLLCWRFKNLFCLCFAHSFSILDYNERLPFVVPDVLKTCFFVLLFFLSLVHKEPWGGAIVSSSSAPFSICFYFFLLLERLAGHGFVFPIYMNKACFPSFCFVSLCWRCEMNKAFWFLRWGNNGVVRHGHRGLNSKFQF